MKILYVGKFWHPWSTENYVTHALCSLGVKVIKRPFTRSLSMDALQSQVKEANVDVVLFSKPSKEWYPPFIRWCREQGVVTVAWLWDKYFGLRSQLPWSISADLVFSTDGGSDQEWIKEGVSHHTLRQGIHLPESILINDKSPNQYHHDVGFVGTRCSYPQRRRLVDLLQAMYKKRFILHTHTRGLALNRALSRVKVVVGDSYPSPGYWSNRIYEITGRGGFFMHPFTEGLNSHFTPGVHYIPFERGDKDQMKEIIDYYVKNNEEREIIRMKGFTHCRSEHTYQHRAESLLTQIRQFKTNNPSQSPESRRLRSPEVTGRLGGV